MIIYKYLNYINFLKDQIQEEKQKITHFTQSKLSEKSGIQNTYLSNCLKGRANLNADQLFSIADFFHLDEESTDYLLLLREYNLCTLTKRKAQLKTQIKRIQSEKLATEQHLDIKTQDDLNYQVAYYSDPLNTIVHVLLGMKQYENNKEKIAQDLQIPLEQLEAVLKILEDLKLIQFSNGKYKVLQKGFHLPANSPLTWAHQALLRHRSIHRLSQLNAQKKYSMSATFSADETTKAKIQAEYLKFIKKAQTLVKGAPAKQAYQLNFDLFPWN